MSLEFMGEPFVGEVHTSDASSGVSIPIRKTGTEDTYTLASNEYLSVHHIALVSENTGDAQVALGARTVVRGTFAANGGLEQSLRPPVLGQVGDTLEVTAPTGDVDVLVQGTIRRRGDNTDARPAWRENRKGRD